MDAVVRIVSPPAILGCLADQIERRAAGLEQHCSDDRNIVKMGLDPAVF